MNLFPTAPINIVFVQFEKKLYDSFLFDSGVRLYKDTSFHPEEHSMAEATIVSVPRALQDRFDYAGMSIASLKPGDRVLIRYDVVFHYHHQPDRDTPIYKNLLLHEGVEYWRVDIQQIFAILRKGTVEMLNGYVMCDPCVLPNEFGFLEVPEHYQRQISNELYRIRYIDKPLSGDQELGLKSGDRVHIRPGIAQYYETDWGAFSIIKQSHILAIEMGIADSALLPM